MRLLRTFVLLALLGATITGTPRFAPAPLRESSPAATASSQDLRPEILALLSSGLIPGSPTPLETTLVQHFYAADAAPVWIDDAGGPSAAGRQALDLLAGADSHGLAPARYALTASPDNVVSFEVELTLAMLRFMDDISTGRVDPASLGFQLPAGLDAAALIHTATVSHTHGKGPAHSHGGAVPTTWTDPALLRAMVHGAGELLAGVLETPESAGSAAAAVARQEAFAVSLAEYEAALGDLKTRLAGRRLFAVDHGLEYVARAADAPLLVTLLELEAGGGRNDHAAALL